jgi:hypothetical protein
MTSDHVQQRIVLLLTDVHDAARAGDWHTVRQETEQVLRLNPFNPRPPTGCWPKTAVSRVDNMEIENTSMRSSAAAELASGSQRSAHVDH